MAPSIFYESIAQQESPYAGAPISMTPELNLTGLPGLRGPQGTLLQMILQPLLQQALGPNFLPAQFSPTHNLFDHYRQRSQFQQMQMAMGQAKEGDHQTIVQFIRGMGALRGVQWTQEREQAAQIWASDMGTFTPMLAQAMPALFDQIMGSRGSSMVMAQSVFSGGRHYVDPVTGTMGLSAQSASSMTNEIFQKLYGPGADLAAMRGLGAGSVGMLFDEGARRGLMPRALSRDEQMRGMAEQDIRGRGVGADGVQRELAGVMDELRRLDNPQLEGRIRQFEAGRVSERLRNLTGAISAMRDIFGDMGHPDAPVAVLVDGLNALTQGGLATTSPDRLEAIARDFANSMRRSGVSMDRGIAMAASAAGQADAMGLDRSVGVNAAMRAANFGMAYASVVGGAPAWGRVDRARMEAIDVRLRVNAEASPVANQLAATIRLGQDVGFQAGSEASALYQAVRSGQDTYSFGGQSHSVYDRTRWRDIVTAGGVDSRLASAYRSDTAYNQRTISENDLGDLSRRLQGRVDISPRIGRAYTIGARQAGVTDEAELARIREISSQALLEGLSEDQIQDPDAMARYMAERMGVRPDDTARMNQLRLVATRGWSSWEQAVRSSAGLRGFRTGDAAIMAQRQRTLQRTASNLEEARIDSRMQTALSSLGGGPLQRIVDSVIAASPDTSVRDLAARAVGWFPEGDVGDAMAGTVRQLTREMEIYGAPEQVRRQALALQSQISSGVGGAASTIALQALADRYTSGNVGDLTGDRDIRAAVRRQALERIRGFSAQFARPADAANYLTGPSTPATEAAKELQDMADLRGVSVQDLERSIPAGQRRELDRINVLRARMEAGQARQGVPQHAPAQPAAPGSAAAAPQQQLTINGTLEIAGLGRGALVARGRQGGAPAT